MSILVKTVESTLGNGNEAFYCRKNGKYTNLHVHTIVRWLSEGKVWKDFDLLGKTWVS